MVRQIKKRKKEFVNCYNYIVSTKLTRQHLVRKAVGRGGWGRGRVKQSPLILDAIATEYNYAHLLQHAANSQAPYWMKEK